MALFWLLVAARFWLLVVARFWLLVVARFWLLVLAVFWLLVLAYFWLIVAATEPQSVLALFWLPGIVDTTDQTTTKPGHTIYKLTSEPKAVEQIKFKWRMNSENKNPVSIQSCLYSIKAMTVLVGWLSLEWCLGKSLSVCLTLKLLYFKQTVQTLIRLCF